MPIPQNTVARLCFTLSRIMSRPASLCGCRKQKCSGNFCERYLEEDSDSARNLGARIPHLERRILSISLGRTLVSTERGYFALAPRIPEENDLCCVIFGCSYPFILRKVECPLYSEQ